MNRFKVNRRIQKLRKRVDANDFLINMVVDQHREAFVATRDKFEIYVIQNDILTNLLEKLLGEMTIAHKNAQDEIFELKTRVDALEKK